jgi:hypothetical protein
MKKKNKKHVRQYHGTIPKNKERRNPPKNKIRPKENKETPFFHNNPSIPSCH